MPDNNTWSLFDMHYHAWKAFHGTKKTLDRDGPGVGAVYAACRSVLLSLRTDLSGRQIFCFDPPTRTLHRTKAYPGYKQTREQQDAIRPVDEQEDRQALMQELHAVRDSLIEYGACVGYQEGFEADDILARAAKELAGKGRSVVLHTADRDLFQVLGPGVIQVTQSLNMNHKRLHNEYGVTPAQWPIVKAIAGCETDDVGGVPGVQDKTAAKYVSGKLPVHWAAYRAIEEHKSQWTARLPIVTLPWKGTPHPDYRKGQNGVQALKALFKERGWRWLT